MRYSENCEKKIVAVCMAKYNDNDQAEFIRKFDRVCDAFSIKPIVFATSTYFNEEYDNAPEEQIFALMDPSKFDAVVVLSDTFKRPKMLKDLVNRVLRSGTLCISLLAKIDGCVNILFNYKDSFEQVVRHILCEHDVKNVNFIAGMKGNPYSEERLRAFMDVMEEKGLTVENDRIGYGNFWEGPTAEVMEKFLSSGKKIDAIICANDFMAMEACRILRERGIRVPEDIIVSGFDGVEIEQYHYPRLTTAYHDTEEMCAVIANIVEDSCSNLPIKEEYYIGCKFREGQSCGCIDPNFFFGEYRELAVKSFMAHGRIRDMENHLEIMYEKAPKLANMASLSDVWGDILYLAKRYVHSDLDLLINDDFLMEDKNLWQTLLPYDPYNRKVYYTTKMRSIIHYKDGLTNDIPFVYSAELIPGFNDAVSRPGSLLIVPVSCQGDAIGYISANIIPDEIDFFMFLVLVKNIISVIEAHKSRLDQQNLFSTDQLTKLLNRKGFYLHMEKKVSEAKSKKIPIAVISLDLNRLKEINDTFGHKEGDFSLAKISSILTDAVGKRGTATRFGGDEFAAAIVGKNAARDAAFAIEELKRRLTRFNESHIKPYEISTSIGMVCHVPSDTDTLEKFLNEADNIMYEDKKRSRRYKR